ncbi:17035_t:CDS:2 [Racocetra persica]|uniref:17035_t:CDS:1 n=1 Tax=Racocetra persica TaxID=160502 RepID=A0ACA9NP18_9GLOM|nr:17035_t:CDS:2 [Racocetra persica]
MQTTITLPAACDFHLHARQGVLMEMVAPRIAEGGVSLCYVMPNLKPPITSTEQALEYKAQLERLAPNVTFLMSLYLCPELTPEEIRKAKKHGIVGVKSYPRGVTTNSESGIESYAIYYPVFKAMEEVGLILNLHGELPSDADQDICVMNAEEKFLVHLKQLHNDFPKLKIVLEHATTKAAVDTVKDLGDTIGCTITIHHLQLIVDDWAGQCHNFCKPVAKFPHDRQALRDVVLEEHPRFFLGTDSAPHPAYLKECAHSCAGVFTTPLAIPYLATVLDSFGAINCLRKFACENGKKFYGVSEEGKYREITLVKETLLVPHSYSFDESVEERKGTFPSHYIKKKKTLMACPEQLPLELILAVFTFIPARDLCRYLSLSKALRYEIRKIIVERIQREFKTGNNYLLVTIEPLDTYSSGPTHIFDLMLCDVDILSLNTRFKINDKAFDNSSPIKHDKTFDNSSPIKHAKIIGRKLQGTERWETILHNSHISIGSTWLSIFDPSQTIRNVSLHVFSPFDLKHETTYVSKGSLTFKINLEPESIKWWNSNIDDYSTIVVSNMIREFDDFQSLIVMSLVEEVIVNAGVLLTAIEEKWQDDVECVVIEDPED